MEDTISFTSVLHSSNQEKLERLMFFNPQQRKALAGINSSIADFGVPVVYAEEERLRVRLQGLTESQTLFAVDQRSDPPELVGVIVYVRPDVETLVLLHIAVDEEYTRTGKHADRLLVFRLVGELRKIARRIRGVQNVILKYSGNLSIPVAGSAGEPDGRR